MTEENNKKWNKRLIWIVIVLSILLMISIGYISLRFISESVYQEGYNAGRIYEVSQVNNLQIPYFFNNQELNRTEIKYINAGTFCQEVYGQ